MSSIPLNEKYCSISIEVDADTCADMLLEETNTKTQAEFLKRFFSLLPFDNVLEISKEIGEQDRAYHGLKNLFEYATKRHIEFNKERLEYEQSEEAKRDREYNDRLFEYSPDGRPWW